MVLYSENVVNSTKLLCPHESCIAERFFGLITILVLLLFLNTFSIFVTVDPR